MARKPQTENAGDARLDKTAGDAAALLTEQLASFGAATRACLRHWQTANDGDSEDAEYYLDAAVKLAEASAKLGDAVARMRSESRQRISVERVAPAPAKAPPGASASQGNALNAHEKSDSATKNEGGGGDRE